MTVSINKAFLTLFLFVVAVAAHGQKVQTAATLNPNAQPLTVTTDHDFQREFIAAGEGDADTNQMLPLLTRERAVQLALQQASAFQQAQLNEQIAALDIKQAKAAFYPRIALNPAEIYTTPSLGTFNPSTNTSRPPSFLGANAITENQGLVNASGEIDTAGRLRAGLRRSQAILEAAHLGTEIERRNLIFAVNDAYFNLALAAARRQAALENLRAASEFENNVKLNLDAGEVAPVELIRARLQTTARRDELAQAEAAESAAADSLRVLIGYRFETPIATTNLLLEVPQPGEIENLSSAAIAARPELAQFNAQIRAATEDVKAAQRERRPNLTYSINSGFISDSLNPTSIKNSAGAQITVGVSIPLFDAGSSRSRQTQALLRAESLQNQRLQSERLFAQAFFTARAQGISANTRVRLAGQGIEDAKSNLSAALARYQAGEALINEVTDAQNTLIVQQTALSQAIFEYQSARLRLLQAIGK